MNVICVAASYDYEYDDYSTSSRTPPRHASYDMSLLGTVVVIVYIHYAIIHTIVSIFDYL